MFWAETIESRLEESRVEIADKFPERAQGLDEERTKIR
jgi:uncharacterized membrane protein (UPF0127 family)